MTQTASDTQLNRLNEAARRTYQMMQSGEPIEDAVTKIASEEGFNRHWTGRLVELTNRLSCMHHLTHADDSLKSASFPTADTERVMQKLFPDRIEPGQVTKAACVEPRRPTRYADLDTQQVKAASAAQTDPLPSLRFGRSAHAIDHLWSARYRLQHEAKQASDRLQQLQYDLDRDAKKLAGELTNLEDPDLADRTASRFGRDWAKAAMAILGRHAPIKQANNPDRVFTKPVWDIEPYTKLAGFIGKLHAATIEADALSQLQKLASVKAGAIQAEPVKQAVAGIRMLDKVLGEGGEDVDRDRKRRLWEEAGVTAEDLDTVNRIRSMQALVSAVHNDPVIQRARPGDVQRAYNMIASSGSPRIMMNEAALAAHLRQALEQPDITPHDVEQMGKVEQQLARADDTGE